MTTSMNPRLRVLYLGEGQRLLIVDRLDALLGMPVQRERIEALIAGMPKNEAISGTLVFPCEVDVPAIDDTEPLLAEDERATMKVAVDHLRRHVLLLSGPEAEHAKLTADALSRIVTRTAP